MGVKSRRTSRLKCDRTAKSPFRVSTNRSIESAVGHPDGRQFLHLAGRGKRGTEWLGEATFRGLHPGFGGIYGMHLRVAPIHRCRLGVRRLLWRGSEIEIAA